MALMGMPAYGGELQMSMDPTAPRVKVISPGCELRLIVDDDKHARAAREL